MPKNHCSSSSTPTSLKLAAQNSHNSPKLHQSKCISTAFCSSSHRPLFVRPRVLITVPRNPRNFFAFLPRNMCSSSISDTLLVAGKSGEVLNMKLKDEFGDLKSWMHKNGLPPCKVVLLERPSHDNKLRPIHYVAASEDLQAGDIAISVPNLLVVTLERVSGNETIGSKIHVRLRRPNGTIHMIFYI